MTNMIDDLYELWFVWCMACKPYARFMYLWGKLYLIQEKSDLWLEGCMIYSIYDRYELWCHGTTK